MTPTIAFREYVHLLDEIGLAFGGEQDDLQVIAAYLKHITYLGKRGSFIQMLDQPLWIEHLPTDFIPLQGPDLQNGELPSTFPLGLIQRVDEWGAELTFEKANVFDEEKIRPERDRQRMDVLIPYRLVRAGRGFTLYERSKG